MLSWASMTTVVVPLSAFLMFTFLYARSADSACRSCADKLSLALLKDIEAISIFQLVLDRDRLIDD